MKQFKGTQGEWIPFKPKSSNGWVSIIKKDTKEEIVTCYSGLTPVDFEIITANAKLIAAAPELLKSLQDLYQIAHELQWENYLSGRQLIVEQAEKAINKALGND